MAAKKSEKQMVKLETALAIGFIALILGFFGGYVISSKPTAQYAQQSAPPPQLAQQQLAQQRGPTQEMLNAIKVLEDKVAATPNDISSMTRLANMYFDTDQFDKAIDTYKKILSIDSQNANIWTDLGVMYLRNNRPQDALEAFNRAIAADPKHEQSRFNKGIVLTNELNDHAGAIAAWEGLLKINPNARGPRGETLSSMIDHLKNAIATP